MCIKNIDLIFTNIKKTVPVIHNISNIVTVNDCANITLAAYGSPTMADNPDEVEEITSICNGFVINMGNISDYLVESMVRAGKRSNELDHPVVLDPVGAGVAKKRNDVLNKLLNEIKFSVIRGNISEIKFLANGTGGAKGVDANASDKATDKNLETIVDFAKDLSKKTGSIIAISGEIDIVADSKKAYIIRNGHEMMARVTGTGCMLSSLIGVFISVNKQNILDATAAAIGYYGYCGELAYKKTIENNNGTSSFRTYLIDYVSQMDYQSFKGGAKIEIM